MVIIAQIIRAILLASATAATFLGRRASSFQQPFGGQLAARPFGRPDHRHRPAHFSTGRVAVHVSSADAAHVRCLPPVECFCGVKPSQAARWRPEANAAGSTSIAKLNPRSDRSPAPSPTTD